MSGTVRKAVIPAAGLGTRFLPVVKAQPKEMLPIVDKPAIQYVVEEAVGAGIRDILVIAGRNKRAIEDYFDRNIELELALERSGKSDALREVQAITELAAVHSVRQHDALGLGHAVSVARPHVGTEPFAVMLGDDIMVDDSRLLCSMIAAHERHQASVIALLEVSRDEISSYGCAEVDPEDGSVVRVRSVVEKPSPEDAPSTLAVIGRYVFTPSIFDALERTEPGVGGELQITDAIGALIDDEPVYGVRFEHGRYDAGQKLDFLRANVELALDRPDLGPAFASVLARIVRERGLA